MKKIICLLLCAALAFSLIPIGMVSASAESYTVRMDYQFVSETSGLNYVVVGSTDDNGYVSRPEREPERRGLTLYGWYTSTDYAFYHYFDFSRPIDEDITLYARWVSDDDCVTVSIYTTSFTEPTVQVFVPYGDSYQPAEPAEPDTVFMGWYTDPNFAAEYDMYSPITKDISVYARFVRPEDITGVWIYLDPEATEATAGVDVVIGDRYGLPDEPGRDGATFEGWYTDRALTQKYDPTKPIMQETCLYPKFSYKTPSIASLRSGQVGVDIHISEDVNATKFRIFRKAVGETKWKIIGDTTDHDFTDGTAVTGVTYYYTVRCVNAIANTYQSKYNDPGWKITYYQMPWLKSVTPNIKGMKVVWYGTKGVYGYRVFRKYGKSWKSLATTTATSYIDTTVKSGSEYTYTVRGVDKRGNFITDYDHIGITAAYVAAPRIASVTNTASGAKIAWSASSGAAKYRVFAKTGTSGWKKIADTESTSYVHTNLRSGQVFTYTVRALDLSGSYASAYDTAGKSNVYISVPAVPTLKNTRLGVQITSTLPKGTVKYAVFRKQAGAARWTRILTNIPAGTKTVLDRTAKKGVKYAYTVRCISKDGKTYTSGYNAFGRTITCKR